MENENETTTYLSNLIPHVNEVGEYLEFYKFMNKFRTLLDKSESESESELKSNSNSVFGKFITFDFEDYKYKDGIISILIKKGYNVQYMKFKHMYSIVMNVPI
jgi:hypothetical protein